MLKPWFSQYRVRWGETMSREVEGPAISNTLPRVIEPQEYSALRMTLERNRKTVGAEI